MTIATLPLVALLCVGAADAFSLSRRGLVSQGALASGAAALLGNAGITYAAEGGTDYIENTVALTVPSGWERKEGNAGLQAKTIAWVNTEEKGTNAALVFSPVRPDYTSLGAFGTMEDVERFILPAGVNGKMLGSKAVTLGDKKAYIFDYLVEPPQQPVRHLKTLFTLKPQLSTNDAPAIISLTAQTLEENFDRNGAALDQIIGSFKFY